MLVFPQLSTGASVQYPVSKQLAQRNVESTMEDGTIISLADEAANYLRWRVAFQDLSDQEAGSIGSFFEATQGNLLSFLFLDPTTNLLLWSEDFSPGAWENTGITFDSAVADPLGGTRASRAHNNTSTSLAIAQGTQIPGLVQVCFSVYLRSNTPITVSLTRTAGSQSQNLSASVTSTWQRFYLSGTFASVADSSQFAVSTPAGASLELFAPQVDAQVTPSSYVKSGARAGVYTNARFDMKQIDVIATGPDRNTCVVYVRCNLPAGE